MTKEKVGVKFPKGTISLGEKRKFDPWFIFK
jgi:hypothetical protein